MSISRKITSLWLHTGVPSFPDFYSSYLMIMIKINKFETSVLPLHVSRSNVHISNDRWSLQPDITISHIDISIRGSARTPVTIASFLLIFPVCFLISKHQVNKKCDKIDSSEEHHSKGNSSLLINKYIVPWPLHGKWCMRNSYPQLGISNDIECEVNFDFRYATISALGDYWYN